MIDWGWIADHSAEILDRLLEHIQLTGIAVVVGFLISFPLGVFAFRHPRVYGPIAGATGLLYTIPSLALFAFLVPVTGLTVTTAEIGLVSYTLLILIRNIVAGLRGVPPEAVEAARGMGYSDRQLLWRAQLPLALPVIVAGIRLATVTTIGLVTVAALIGYGGLGYFILLGLRQFFSTASLLGAVLSVMLAVGVDAGLVLFEPAVDAVDPRPHNEGRGVIEFFGDLVAWFGDPAHYRGDTSVQARMAAHILISAQSVILAGLVATPIAMFIGHARRFEFVAVTAGNLGRALPSFGVLGLTMPFTLNLPGDLGYWPTFIALFLLAVPPILANTYVGIRGVDPDTVEAARGMGMSERDVLLRLELPLAVPLIVTGWRTASVQVVATATLGAILSLENLGRYIVDGFAEGQRVQVVAGALLLAGLAIATEIAFEIAERVLTPRTGSGKKRVARWSSATGPTGAHTGPPGAVTI